MYSSSLCAERIRTRAPGRAARIWRVASSPFRKGHGDVHQDNVRLQQGRKADRLAAIGGLAHNLDATLRLEKGAETLADDGVVLGEQNLDFRKRFHEEEGRARGRSAWTVVPLPGADWICRDPPIISMRSRMPISPRRWLARAAKRSGTLKEMPSS